MSVDRITRVNELLKREVAEALYRVLDPGAFDMAAVTVTHVNVSRNLRQARVMVSVRGGDAERRAAIDILRRGRADIQAYAGRHVILKYTPRLSFVLDPSIERGSRVLSLLSDLDTGEAPETGDGTAGPPPDDEETLP